MNTKIISVGNSKGVRIPKPLLKTSGLSGDVSISAKNGVITIKRAEPKNDPPKYNEEYLMSLGALNDWNDPEEDEAWAHLQ